MNLRIQTVDTHFVQQVWLHVVGFIEDAMRKSEDASDYNVHHIQGFLTSGQWLLLVAVDEQNEIQGAATISFMSYPLNRVAFVTSIGGKLITNEDTFEQLKAICKQRGATKIQGFGRPAIVRLWQRYNFKPKSTLVEVSI